MYLYGRVAEKYNIGIQKPPYIIAQRSWTIEEAKEDLNSIINQLEFFLNNSCSVDEVVDYIMNYPSELK